MLEDFTYDYLCEGVQDKAVKKKKIDYRYCEECNVERVMYPHLGFYVCSSCGAVGYGESTFIHKKRNCIYKRDEYFRSKIGKFLCREPLKIPDRVLEGELHNSDNILYYYYSQVDSLMIPMLEQLLKRNKLMRYKCNIYNLYFTLTKKRNLHNSLSGNVRKLKCILN